AWPTCPRPAGRCCSPVAAKRRSRPPSPRPCRARGREADGFLARGDKGGNMTRRVFGTTQDGTAIEAVALAAGGIVAEVITLGAVVRDLRLTDPGGAP